MNGISEAWLCPGQGAPPREIAARVKGDPFLREVSPYISELMGEDFDKVLGTDDEALLRRNEISAVLCVVSSVSAGRALVLAGRQPGYLSGYSVGLWSAMHLAGMLDLPALLRAVWTRAQMMNETDGAQRGAMLAVIGLKESLVIEACASASTDADPVEIANFNCPGQYTLAGSRRGIDAVKPLLTNLKAHKVVEVPVQGAWHSSLMAAAVPRFEAFLKGLALTPPRIPVLGNLTGDPLPEDRAALCAELAGHLSRPVQWNGVIRQLLNRKVERFVETGYGNTLTKFGMFIDRSVSHVTWGQALKANI